LDKKYYNEKNIGGGVYMNKVAIVGSGFVGATAAYTLAVSGTVNEIALIDINRTKAEGDALDIAHGIPLIAPLEIYAGDYSDAKGADIIIISAGANSRPNESRLDLVHKNTAIFKSFLPELVKANDSAIYLVVANPVDILAYVTQRVTGLPPDRVISSGTLLDSSRLRYLLSQSCRIDPRSIHGYMIGEHGDSELAAWSITNIAGLPINDYCNICKNACGADFRNEIVEKVKRSAYEIIEKKGATYYAVALSIRRIVECILRDERSILTVSSLLTGQYGISGVCLSLPSIVGRNGVEKVLELPLSDEEIRLFNKSANILKDIIKQIDI
jgi:L-lactate dehydrogenase